MFCMFDEPLKSMQPDLSYMNRTLIDSRLDIAKERLTGSKNRYTLVPAAAGAEDGALELQLMTAQQMIAGGTVGDFHQDELKLLEKYHLKENRVNWPVVDVVSWL